MNYYQLSIIKTSLFEKLLINHWLFGSLALWLFGSLALWLFGSLALWLFGSLTIGSLAH
jgi:hypothetical protein